MPRRIGIAVASAVAIVAVAVPASAGAIANGKIAFSDQDAGHIWTVNPDGTGLTDLTPKATFPYCDPQWSPSGERIAFIEPPHVPDFAQTGQLWVMNADGSGRYLIPSAQIYTAACDRLAWSPDGTKIAYTGETGNGVTDNGIAQIDVVASNGLGLPRHLTDGTRNSFGPSWSPDGQSIAYWAYEPGPNFPVPGTEIVPARGGTARPLPNSIGYTDPDWSPDGTRLITDHFNATYPIDANEVWTITPTDGTPIQRLTNGDNNFDAAWSPDGTKFTYVRRVKVNDIDYNYIATDPADGTGTGTRVLFLATGGGTTSRLPDWQPVP